MKITFIGDVHGNLDICKRVASTTKGLVVQIGDLGVGFLSIKKFLSLPVNFKFFPGNHDNRQQCHLLPHCLGDYGEVDGKFFFVSGADSIDKDNRIEGVSWWPDEELSYKQLNHTISLWEQSRVEILVAHDCPQQIVQYNHLVYDSSRTRQALDQMLEIRKPKIIIYGHHHRSGLFNYNGITIKPLGINEVYTINV